MKSTPDALVEYFSRPGHRCAYYLKIERADGAVTVRGTGWDVNLTINGETYLHTQGGALADVEQSSSLDVGNTEVRANFGAITETDIRNGLWDEATYELGRVNPDATSMGRDIVQKGGIGSWTLGRLGFVAELFDTMQHLQQTFGRVVTPTCPYAHADVGSGQIECTLNEDDWKTPGTLAGVSDDQLTFYDPSRTEPGPAGGVEIVSITPNGSSTIIETATALGLPTGSAVTLSGIEDPAALNGTVAIRRPSGPRFEIDLDTSDTAIFPPYGGSGGVATPEGAESGYFGYGVMIVSGVRRPIKSYVPGQWTIQRPFPFTLIGNEAYELVAGDDKTFNTCRTKFSNQDSFGGFPYLRGTDSVMQVGRRV